MTNIAKNLKALRKAKKMSQKKVSLMTGIPRSSLSGYENKVAEPPICVIIKLADFYNTPIDFLIR